MRCANGVPSEGLDMGWTRAQKETDWSVFPFQAIIRAAGNTSLPDFQFQTSPGNSDGGKPDS